MTTVLECIDSGTRYLEKRGVEDARRNMQMLIAHRLQCTRMQLYLRFDEPLGENILIPLREDLKKRGERVPLQHLLGTVCFHNRDFISDARALIPRPETEELVELLLKEFPDAPAQILDMGCGSGVLGITLACEWPAAQVALADISPSALALAQENASALKAENTTFIVSDLFSALTGRFELIVANLPYVSENERSSLTPEVMHDPALALFSGADGLDCIRRFLAAAPDYLTDSGSIALEIGYDQAAAVQSILQQLGYQEISIRADISGVLRFPLAKCPRSANAVLPDK
jgi:release factor glutamine methyltransferase